MKTALQHPHMRNINVIEVMKTTSAQILVVEDESIIALNLQEVLESLDYCVPAVVASAEQAITQAAELQPNLVLMDICLQGEMDGIQAAEQIWEQLQIPVIYLTGHSDRSTVERVRLTAPFGYLLKPIKKQELYVAIESALQRCERERWMSAVLRSMGDGVIVVDAQEKVKFLNPVAEAITGWSFAQAKDRLLADIFKIVHEQTHLPIESPVAVTLTQGDAIYLENDLLLVTENGTAIPIANSIAPFCDRSGALTGAVLVFRDITARQQAQERDLALEQARQLHEQMVELERLNQLKDDFISTVSHELRTPLTNIKMAIKMLQLVLDRQGLMSPNNDPNSQALVKYVDILRSQSDRELHLVNDLLDLQRLNSDIYPMELTPISLLECISQVVASFQARLQERQLSLQLDIQANLPPLISDLPSLNRIFSELLNNACKYTPPGEQIALSVVLKQPGITQIAADAFSRLPYFLIRVCNSGVEIPAQERSRIFEPFYRLPNGDRYKQGGTGLGLALVKKLVESLNGSIQVESGMGKTCFVIEFYQSIDCQSPLSRDT